MTLIKSISGIRGTIGGKPNENFTPVDIVKFTSAVLSQNIRVDGKPRVHLHAASDKKDTDFAVRLTDVYPDNRSMLVSDGIFRMRFHNGFTTADTASLVIGQIYSIIIDMADVGITFQAGHRIRLDVSSSNYPRYDCNLNNGLQMYAAGDTSVATQIIYFDNAHESYLELPVADSAAAVPEIIGLKKLNVAVYPNPASDFINVISKNNSLKKLELYDISGKRIFVFNNPSAEASVDVRNFDSGIYFLKAYSEKEISVSRIALLKR